MLEVDFLAGDQSVIALRFQHGATQLRFGDDFGLSIFKRELRRLLPSGIDHWRRNFGYHVDKSAKPDDEGEEGDDLEGDDDGGDPAAQALGVGGGDADDEDEDEG